MKRQEEKSMVFLLIQRHLLQKSRGVKGNVQDKKRDKNVFTVANLGIRRDSAENLKRNS
jgi:hypothetical protein